MLKLDNISKRFSTIEAVSNFSFDFPEGEITIIAGADGSGKSTLFRIITGLESKDSGKIYIKGKEIEKDFSPITSISGYMPEIFSLYPDLTVDENLNFFADIYRIPKKERDKRKEDMLTRTGMIRFTGRRAGSLSGGMKQKLALSTILLSNPALIILDEPTTGVDPLSRMEFLEILNELKKEGTTIIIATPYLDEAESGDNIIFIKSGKVLKKGSINSIKEDFPVRLFSYRPEENIFDFEEKLKTALPKDSVCYIRGSYINFTSNRTVSELKSDLSLKELQEISPKLEDIYLYYKKISDQTQV